MTITKESYREMRIMYMYVHIITSEWHCWASVSEIFSYSYALLKCTEMLYAHSETRADIYTYIHTATNVPVTF